MSDAAPGKVASDKRSVPWHQCPSPHSDPPRPVPVYSYGLPHRLAASFHQKDSHTSWHQNSKAGLPFLRHDTTPYKQLPVPADSMSDSGRPPHQRIYPQRSAPGHPSVGNVSYPAHRKSPHCPLPLLTSPVCSQWLSPHSHTPPEWQKKIRVRTQYPEYGYRMAGVPDKSFLFLLPKTASNSYAVRLSVLPD